MAYRTHKETERVEPSYRRSQRLPLFDGGVIRSWPSSGQSVLGAAAANILYAVPLYLPDTCRVDYLSCEVTTGAAGNARMGLYTDSGGYPATRLLVATEITTMATAGIKRQTVGLTLPYGFYWGAIVFDSTPTMREDDNGAGLTMHWLGGTDGTDVTIHPGINVAFAYAALPTPFTASATLSTTVQPKIIMTIGKYGELS